MTNYVFNEREAILFEMQELKEHGRREFELYFEMRKHRNQRYNELQNRLRELDEIDHKRIIETPAPIEMPHISKNIDKTVIDLQFDRIEKDETKQKKAFVPMAELTEEIERFLTHNGHTKTATIQKHVEQKFNTKWVNFNSTLRGVVNYSKIIKIDKSQPRKFLYYV